MTAHAPRALSAFALALACACASTPRVNLQTEEQAIREIDRRWVQAVAAKDVATIVGLHTADAVVMAPNAPVARGTEAIRTLWTQFLGSPNLSMTFAPTRVDVAASGDLATDIGTYRLSMDGPQGRIDDEGSYTTGWRKQANGEWKVTSDIFTSSRPIPMPPATGDVVLIIEPPGDQMMMATAAGASWTDLSVPGFPAGMKLAVIHGDPAGKGDYTIRLRFPDGYNFPAHYHPNAEHLTVLSGSLVLGMGGRVDASKLATHRPGDFLYIPAKVPHFGGARGETVIQLHGIGPFDIKLAQ